jgi:hypothetical protein
MNRPQPRSGPTALDDGPGRWATTDSAQDPEAATLSKTPPRGSIPHPLC